MGSGDFENCFQSNSGNKSVAVRSGAGTRQILAIEASPGQLFWHDRSGTNHARRAFCHDSVWLSQLSARVVAGFGHGYCLGMDESGLGIFRAGHLPETFASECEHQRTDRFQLAVYRIARGIRNDVRVLCQEY